MKVTCLLCAKEGKETILSSSDNGIIARSTQEEMMAIGKAMAVHMDVTHNSTMVNEIRAIPMYNGFNVMKYFEEPVGPDSPIYKTNIAGEEVETNSEFNSQKEYMRTQLSEQLMQFSPELDEDEDDDDLEDDDEINFEDDEEDEDEDEEDDGGCDVCECNPCQCDDTEDEEGEDLLEEAK